jgi:hypothetical protein
LTLLSGLVVNKGVLFLKLDPGPRPVPFDHLQHVAVEPHREMLEYLDREKP